MFGSFLFRVFLGIILSMIGRVVSSCPFPLTMVALRTPFILSTFYRLLKDGHISFVSIRFVTLVWTTVSPILAKLQLVLLITVCLAIEFLLQVGLAFESLLVAGFVHLNLC